MWSFGTLFGMPFKVDMAYTREHGVLRIYIGCVDASKIPTELPVFIKDGFYLLSFEKENIVSQEDVQMETSNDDQEGDPDKDKNKEEDDLQGDMDTSNIHFPDVQPSNGSTNMDASGGPAQHGASSGQKAAGVFYSPMVKKAMSLTRKVMNGEVVVDKMFNYSSSSLEVVKRIKATESALLRRGCVADSGEKTAHALKVSKQGVMTPDQSNGSSFVLSSPNNMVGDLNTEMNMQVSTSKAKCNTWMFYTG